MSVCCVALFYVLIAIEQFYVGSFIAQSKGPHPASPAGGRVSTQPLLVNESATNKTSLKSGPRKAKRWWPFPCRGKVGIGAASTNKNAQTMKKVLILILFAICLYCTATAQQTVNTSTLAHKVLEKGLKETDLGLYQGSLLLQAMTELSLATNDKTLQTRTINLFKKFGTKQIEGKGSFISYSSGGSGAAYVNYLGGDTSLNTQVSEAAKRMVAQQKRSSEGLLIASWLVDSLDPVFIDMAFAVTPYLLYTGLKERNNQYIDLAIFETLQLFKILKDEKTGLLHQGRGFAGKGSISEDNWSRGNGWGALAIATLIRDLPASHPKRGEVEKIAKAFFEAVLRHQDADGLWHQEMTDKGSFTETSGSGLLLYGLGIMLEKGLLPKNHQQNFVKGLNGLTAYIADDGGVSHACFSCLCPRKGRKEDYVNHVWVYNDPHAFGPVVLAYAQAIKMGINELKPLQPAGSMAVLDTITNVVKTYVRYIPERSQDIAWENDRIAFRYYGPPVRDKVSSGIDIFCKSVDYSIIDKWYRLNARGLDYHVDRGEGCDFYHAGFLRGCGGTAIWVNGKPYPSTTYASHHIIQNSKDKIVFQLVFDSWNAGGTMISEKKTITMVNGTNFFKIESVIQSSSPEDIAVGIGLTTFGHPSLIKNSQQGLLASWEKTDSTHGHLGTAVVANPTSLKGFAKSTDDEYVLITVKPNQPFIYYVGAGWEGNPHFKNNGAWQNEMAEAANWKALNAIYKNEIRNK